MAKINFGTSGWREIIARDFTFDNVRLATQAIAHYLNTEMRNEQSALHFSRAGRDPGTRHEIFGTRI